MFANRCLSGGKQEALPWPGSVDMPTCSHTSQGLGGSPHPPLLSAAGSQEAAVGLSIPGLGHRAVCGSPHALVCADCMRPLEEGVSVSYFCVASSLRPAT